MNHQCSKEVRFRLRRHLDRDCGRAKGKVQEGEGRFFFKISCHNPARQTIPRPPKTMIRKWRSIFGP
ncbi:unnamed protein product [Allacma fusca]|uniref:Uncharacterized protein n=1 Tax=Allacma fusca TaxID=39272 RepID=A0A8J2KTE6_9HEXA|nr:unnamed protein product [Allacma fusca]